MDDNFISNVTKIPPQVQYTNNYSEQGKPASCRTDFNPQQSSHNFGGVTIDSEFDTGNMSYAEKGPKANHYFLWISPDCAKTSRENNYRSWWHFRVKGISSNTTATFTLKNQNSHGKMYREGHVPVFKSSLSGEWKRILGGPIDGSLYKAEEKHLEVTFTHKFSSSDEAVKFAFTYPWAYEEGMKQIDDYEKQFWNDDEIYFHRTCLILSREQRRVELVTISDQTNKQKENVNKVKNLYPFSDETRPKKFKNKKYVFFSARVHPGELPGSHTFNGIIKFLMDKDNEQAKTLRQNFVFCMIPFLNPDGVYRGHYRTDTSGLNLNRYYLNPSLTDHPSIYAVKEFVNYLNTAHNLEAYIDLHAHASRRGCFMFGNCADFKQQVDICLFPRILALNSEVFEYEGCNFTEKNMYSRDKGDGLSKEGAGRVALYKQTKVPLCYTVECNYNTGLITNKLQDKVKKPTDMKLKLGQFDQDVIKNFIDLEPEEGSKFYDIKAYEDLGEGILVSLLDYFRLNPYSRIFNTRYKTLDNLKLHLASNLSRINPHKKSLYVRKLNRAVNHPEKSEIGIKNLQVYLEKGIKNDPFYEEKEDKKPQVRNNSVKRGVSENSKDQQKKPVQLRNQNMNSSQQPSSQHNYINANQFLTKNDLQKIQEHPNERSIQSYQKLSQNKLQKSSEDEDNVEEAMEDNQEDINTQNKRQRLKNKGYSEMQQYYQPQNNKNFRMKGSNLVQKGQQNTSNISITDSDDDQDTSQMLLNEENKQLTRQNSYKRKQYEVLGNQSENITLQEFNIKKNVNQIRQIPRPPMVQPINLNNSKQQPFMQVSQPQKSETTPKNQSIQRKNRPTYQTQQLHIMKQQQIIQQQQSQFDLIVQSNKINPPQNVNLLKKNPNQQQLMINNLKLQSSNVLKDFNRLPQIQNSSQIHNNSVIVNQSQNIPPNSLKPRNTVEQDISYLIDVQNKYEQFNKPKSVQQKRNIVKPPVNIKIRQKKGSLKKNIKSSKVVKQAKI